MSQEEPQDTPKNKPKVEPLDRRGSLIGYIKKRNLDIQDDTNIQEKANESPTQRLQRLKSDHAANHNELCNTLRHFLPHIQLIEIERILVEIVSKRHLIDNKTGLYDILIYANRYKLLNEKLLSDCHTIRQIRNNIFHHNHLVGEDDVKRVNYLWRELRAMTSAEATAATKIILSLETKPDKVNEVQKIAEEICVVAMFIDMEVILRKILNRIRNRDTEFNYRFQPPKYGELGNGHALYSIERSNNLLAKSLKSFQFVKSISKSIDCRNEVVHGRSSFTLSKYNSEHVYRSWTLLINLPYTLRAYCLVKRLESFLRRLLISEGVKSDVVEKLWIERLALRVCDEEKCMALLSGSGVSRNDILWLTDFSRAIYRSELNPPNKAEVETLTKLCNGLQNTLNNPIIRPSRRLDTRSRNDARKQAVQRFKHPKSRRFSDQDDFV